MKLTEIFNRAILTGMEFDPRGFKETKKIITKAEKEFEKLEEKDKEYFDTDRLTNPFPDSRILFNFDDEKDVKKIMVGIDIEGPELLLAKQLDVDLAITHHPEGLGYVGLPDVMGVQADIHHQLGVPISTATGLIQVRQKELRRNLMGANFSRPIDFARILGIPYICLHTPADNMVQSSVQNAINKATPETLEDVIDILLGYPEYKIGKKTGDGPTIILGTKSNKAGKVFVDMTGGTSGNKDIYQRLSYAGVDTIVGMHMGSEYEKEVKKYNMNVIIAGHYSSDSIGVTELLGNILPTDVDVINCSGYIR